MNLLLKDYLTQKGLTLVDLSDKMGVTRNTFTPLTTGRTSLTSTVLNTICEVLDCQPWDIIEFDDSGEGEKKKWYGALKNKSFSKLDEYLQRKGITPYKLSKMCKIGDSSIRSILNGHIPRYELVIKICEALNCKLADICEWER